MVRPKSTRGRTNYKVSDMMAQPHDPKLTRNQGLAVSVMESPRRPLSAYTILDRLRDQGPEAPL